MSEATSRQVEARAKMPQISDWERYRSLIINLYIKENRPLREVREILEREHGFAATERTYKVRMGAWKVKKYSKSQEINIRLSQRQVKEPENKIEGVLDPTPVVEGKNVSTSLAKRHLRRMHLSTTAKEPTSQSTQSEAPLSASLGFSTSTQQRGLQSESDEPQVTEVRLPSPADRLSSIAATRLSLECPESRASAEPFNSWNETSWSGTTFIDNDEASDSRRKRRKLSAPDLKPSLETTTLACLFYQHNPQRYNPQNEDKELAKRYRTCAGPGWKSISRLRQHLRRAHLAPKRCESCHLALESHDELENHAQHCLKNQDVDQTLMSDTISGEQWHHLKQKQLPGLSKEQNWIRMYGILFPRDSKTPSPYYDSGASRWNDPTFGPPSLRDLDSLIDHLCSVLPQKIVGGLQGRQTHKQIEASREESMAGARVLYDKFLGVAGISPEEGSDGPADSTHQYSSDSIEELKAQVSKAVLETCTEWQRKRMVEDNGSDEGSEAEESEDGDPAGTVPAEQILSLPSLTPPENQSFRYSHYFPGDMVPTSLDYGESGFLSSPLLQPILSYPPSWPVVSQTGIIGNDLNPFPNVDPFLRFSNMSPGFNMSSDYDFSPDSASVYQHGSVLESTGSRFLDLPEHTASIPNPKPDASYKLPAGPLFDMPPSSALFLPTPDVSPEDSRSTGNS